ncbi:MAG: DUF3015 family protein [Pseudomonadota bacterium]
MKLLLSLASASVAFAAASSFAQSGTVMRDAPNPWLDCGIGAMIFPDDNLEVGAGISNVIWDLGTTAVTSAQSSPDTCNGTSNVKMAVFIERTYPTLETEIAKGYGDNLDALAAMVGADDEATFVAALRREMAEVVLADDADKPEALYFAALAAAEA